MIKRCAISLLVLYGAVLAWGAYLHSPSIDEVGHLIAGLSHWQTGSFDLYRVNPPLVRMIATIPVLAAGPQTHWNSSPPFHVRPSLDAGSDFITGNGHQSFWFFTLARWATIPFSLLGAWTVFRWASELNGTWAGLLALTLWCSCPNILGNAQMITPDAGAAAMGVTCAYLYWHWLKSPSWHGAVLAGLFLGLAELTKTTWIVLFALWPSLWVMWKCMNGRLLSPRDWSLQTGQLALVLVVAVWIINSAYGFEDSFQKLRTFRFASQALAGSRNRQDPVSSRHNRFAEVPLGRLPVPLPKNYLLGIDRQKSDFEKTMYSYLRGEWRMGGWWYYYLYGLGIKVPLGTWVLIFLAAFMPLLKIVPSPAWRDELVLLLPVVVVLTLVSSQTGFNHHLRYVLPIFPFLFIWVSKIALAFSWTHWKLTTVALGALAWSITSSLLVYPHSLSYFNELVGGPKGGPNHLVDSNIDWGQDVLFLKRWLDAHPEARPFGLAYFGSFDPRVAGIEYSLPPRVPMSGYPLPDSGETANKPTAEELGPRPGWYAVSVTILRGYRYSLPDGKGGTFYTGNADFTYFQRFEPVAMVGYSIYIYHVTLDDANRVRRELGLPELTCEESKEPGQ